jgi:hypothetical protein
MRRNADDACVADGAGSEGSGMQNHSIGRRHQSSIDGSLI